MKARVIVTPEGMSLCPHARRLSAAPKANPAGGWLVRFRCSDCHHEGVTYHSAKPSTRATRFALKRRAFERRQYDAG